MRYYIIYFLDYKKNHTITIKDMFLAKEDAYNNLEHVAIDYIKELQGKQQAEICKQDKTPEQLLADKTIKEGMYIKKQDEMIIMYEKITVVLPGRIWNSNDLQVNKIGQFSVTEYNFDDILFKCNCNIKIERKQSIEVPLVINNKTTIRPAYNYLDELKQKLNSGMIKLKPVN